MTDSEQTENSQSESLLKGIDYVVGRFSGTEYMLYNTSFHPTTAGPNQV